MEETGQEHDYLFYSTSNNSKGEAITGGTVYSKYRSVISGSKKKIFISTFLHIHSGIFCNSLNPN